MAFSFQNYGTFSGPGAQYKFRQDDDFTNIFEDPTFNLDDVSMVLLSTPSDYVYLHLDGTSTANVTLERNTGPITQFFVDATTSYFNGSVTIDLNLNVLGSLTVTGSLDGTPTGTLLARIAVADSLPVKPFDIPHPSNGEGHRLRYVCLEGPEIGVYFRGRLTNKTEIELPLYWKDLVHIDSISVQLQPIGSHQDIIVKKVDEKKIYLQPNGGISIDCYYHVYAERKDVEKLIVEYEGQSKNDYPSKSWRDTYPKEFGEI